MLGGIIGDLAATTWQADKTTFYKCLVASDARLSNYGLYTLNVADALIRGTEFDYSCYQRLFNFKTHQEQENLITIVACMAAWTTDDEWEARKTTAKFVDHEKVGRYALSILIPLIISLRNGKTKDQALVSVDELFRDTLLNWDKQANDAMGVVARAWDAFYRWFDFTSVIHSAVKSPVEPHLTAIAAGLLAQAMYGCDYIMLKLKYCKDNYHYFSVPIPFDVGFIKDYDMSVRRFYPKNRALTNVERHIWTPCKNPYEGQYFFKDVYDKIRMAFDTGWENRFGIYLDNGWYYVYRSHCLLARFRIKSEYGRCLITDVQTSNEKDLQLTLSGMVNAINSAQCPPYTDNPVTLRPNEHQTK